MEYKIIQKLSTNFTKGRKGNKIITIVSHQTAGKGMGSLSWLCNPASKASAHYLILRDGSIYQLVKDEDSAWQAGIANKPTWKFYNRINPNYMTIGIEHECYPEVGGDGNLTEEQYNATLWLHKQLVQKYNIPIDRDHLIGHYQIDSVNRPNCPGKAFPWDRLLKDLGNGDEEELIPANVIMNNQKLEAYLINGKTFVEIRKPLEWAGKQVVWDKESNTTTIK